MRKIVKIILITIAALAALALIGALVLSWRGSTKDIEDEVGRLSIPSGWQMTTN